VIDGDDCVAKCGRKDYIVYEETNYKECFACGLFLCDECNIQIAESPEDYRCTKCAHGFFPDSKSKGTCHRQTDIDVEDDTSSNNKLGLIIGIIVGGIILLILIIITVVYYYYRSKKKKSKYSVRSKFHSAPSSNKQRPVSTTSSFDYQNPLYLKSRSAVKENEYTVSEAQVELTASCEEEVVCSTEEEMCASDIHVQKHTAVAAFSFTEDMS
jgi:hypothetical protein